MRRGSSNSGVEASACCSSNWRLLKRSAKPAGSRSRTAMAGFSLAILGGGCLRAGTCRSRCDRIRGPAPPFGPSAARRSERPGAREVRKLGRGEPEALAEHLLGVLTQQRWRAAVLKLAARVADGVAHGWHA